jgi:hypothetical protein
MAMLLCLRKDTGSGQDRWQRQCRIRRRQLRDHIVEAAGNLCLEGVEMGGQFQVIRDDRLDADTGEAFINSEAAIGHHNGIFWGKHQRPQAAGPAPQVAAFLQRVGFGEEGRGKKRRAPVQNVCGLCGNVQASGRNAELRIDIGRFNLCQGGGRAQR